MVETIQALGPKWSTQCVERVGEKQCFVLLVFWIFGFAVVSHIQVRSPTPTRVLATVHRCKYQYLNCNTTRETLW